MGQLLSSLNLRHNVDTVPENNGFDIENATPLPDELSIYNELFALLVQPNSQLLSLLTNYKSASEEIRTAIATPSDENEMNALEAVSPTIEMLRQFYEYSSDLEKGIPRLLDALFKNGSAKDLNQHPGLTKLYANILDFVFEFDCLKIRNPTLQNDFSYYRRTLQRGRISNHKLDKIMMRDVSDGRNVEDDLANRISLFIAYPTPMLKCVIDTTTKYVKANNLQHQTAEWLASMWSACFYTVDTRGTALFCLKVMVISIILYDHIDPSGAFSKCSPINVKNSLKIIRSAEQSTTPNLISTLRHNSKHLNDDSTPKGVKNLVMAT